MKTTFKRNFTLVALAIGTLAVTQNVHARYWHREHDRGGRIAAGVLGGAAAERQAARHEGDGDGKAFGRLTEAVHLVSFSRTLLEP